MSVVGIDFGNQNCIVAIARKGVVEVVTNEVSNRKTPSLVAFDGRVRQLGESAANRLISNASNTIDNIKRLVGKKFDDPVFQRDCQDFHYKTVADENGRVAVEVNYMDEVQRLTPEQITAALFGCLKRITEAALLPQSVQDCVITVPSYYSDVQRRAILDAANIVGLNVLRLMHETTAVALTYGILRTLPESNPIKVLFVDIGHTSTNASVVSLVQGKLKVLGSASDSNLGGRHFDNLLVRRFVAEIAEKHRGLDVTKSKKAMLRLTQTAERTKKMLSANLEAPWNVECIMNDVDVRGMVTRPEFEESASSLLDRVLVPVKTLMHDLNLKTSDLFAVELIGGSVRIPAVRQLLDSWFGKSCSTTCDGDEAVARGAALQCAMLSPSFKVRDFDVQDVTPFGVDIGYGPAEGQIEPDSTSVLFPKFNPIPCVKLLSFFKTEPFQIAAKNSDGQSSNNPYLGRFVVSDIPKSDGKPVKTKVRVKLDLNGLVSVESATAVQEVAEDVVPMSDEPETAAAPEPAVASDEGIAKADDTPMEDAPAPAAAEPASEAAPTPAPAPKKKVKRTEVPVKADLVGGLKPEVFQALFEAEVKMHNEDRVAAETAEKKNDLESYIYEMRDRASGPLSDFFPEQAKSAFLQSLDEAESWLYSGEADEAQKSDFVAKLESLKLVGDAAVKRQIEHDNRDGRVGNLNSLLSTYRAFVADAEGKFAHIDEEKKSKVSSKCDEIASWLADSQSKQERLSKSDDPFLSVALIDSKCKELSMLAEPIMRTPKPKPAEKPPTKGESETAGEGASPADTVRDEVPVSEAKESPATAGTSPDEMMNID